MKVRCLFQHLCSPREVNLDDVYGIFRYLQNNLGNNAGRMKYDTMYKPTDENVFEFDGIYFYECKDFYPGIRK